MARIRTLKPEFWADEKLAPLEPLDRLVFLGLISLADDAGRILDNVRVIDANLFPQTLDTSLEALRRLSGIGRIIRGKTSSGQQIIEIANWSRHQKISHPNLRAAFPEIIEVIEDTAIPAAFRNDSGGAPEALRHHTNDQRPVPTTSDQPPVRRQRVGKREPDGDPAVSWPGEAYEMFKAEIGLLPVPRIAKALKPAVDEFGWETVKPWFRVYCKARPYQKRDGSILGDKSGDTLDGAAKDTRWVTPEDFVKNIAFWRERCAPIVTT